MIYIITMTLEGATRALRPTGRRTSVEQASHALQDAICAGDLGPGEKLVLTGVAAALGMSVTPVREALRQLQREGLVVDNPYAGMRVASLSIGELVDLFEIRGVLDGLAAARGLPAVDATELERARELTDNMEGAIAAGDAERFMDLNAEFHAIFIAPGAPAGGTLAKIMDQVRLHTRRYSAAARHALPPEALRASNAEHLLLLERAVAGDVDGLERLSHRHAGTFSHNLARALELAGAPGEASAHGEATAPGEASAR